MTDKKERRSSVFMRYALSYTTVILILFSIMMVYLVSPDRTENIGKSTCCELFVV